MADGLHHSPGDYIYRGDCEQPCNYFTDYIPDFSWSEDAARSCSWKKPGTTKLPYVYTLPKSSNTSPDGVYTIPANQTASISVSTDKDSNFVCKKITGSAQGEVLITAQDAGRDRQWMNTGVEGRNFLGSGSFPNVLAAPRWVQRGSVVSFTIQDLSGASNNVSLNMIGEKIFG